MINLLFLKITGQVISFSSLNCWIVRKKILNIHSIYLWMNHVAERKHEVAFCVLWKEKSISDYSVIEFYLEGDKFLSMQSKQIAL